MRGISHGGYSRVQALNNAEGYFMAVKTRFITGTSRGFGREWAIAALDRGDEVAAMARDIASLDDLAAKYGERILPIPLDVTDRDAAGHRDRGLRVPARDLAGMAARGRRRSGPRTVRPEKDLWPDRFRRHDRCMAASGSPGSPGSCKRM